MEQIPDQVAYVNILQYLSRTGKPVSPHELALTIKKSRVTIQAQLKRLLQNGWVLKEGTSPRVTYRAIDPFAKNRPVAETPMPKDPRSIDAFIKWCQDHGYHVPETALEYQWYLKVKGEK